MGEECWEALFQRKIGERCTHRNCQRFAQGQQPVRSLFPDGRKRALEILGSAQFERLQRDTKGPRGGIEFSPIGRLCRVGCIPQDSDTRYPRGELLEKVELLGAQLRVHLRKTGNMPARMCQTVNIARPDRIAVNDEYDRHGFCHFLPRGRFCGREGDDQVYVETDEFGGQRRQPVEVTVRRAVLDDNISAADLPQLGEPLVECGHPFCDRRQPPQKTQSVNLRLGRDGRGGN